MILITKEMEPETRANNILKTRRYLPSAGYTKLSEISTACLGEVKQKGK